jgi:CheY-like chemotaxis protein
MDDGAPQSAAARTGHQLPRDRRISLMTMTDMIKLLVVGPGAQDFSDLSQRLNVTDLGVTTARNCREALVLLRHQPFDLALVDGTMSEPEREALVDALRDTQPFTEVVVVQSLAQPTARLPDAELSSDLDDTHLIHTLIKAYEQRVSRRLHVSADELDAMLEVKPEEHPLAILRKLRDLEIRQTQPEIQEPLAP